MSRRWVLLSSVAAGLIIAGCAVLTVDVDVYKGALSNHESVQTEQVAAMAMGAKPLLAELRIQLEQRACHRRLEGLEYKKGLLTQVSVDDDHPDIRARCQAYLRMKNTARFVRDVDPIGRDTARVNAILSLYEDALPDGETEIARTLQELLRELERHVTEGFPIVQAHLGVSKETRPADLRKRARALAAETIDIEKRRRACPGSGEQCKIKVPASPAVEAVLKAWATGREAWREAVRLLASETTRARLSKGRDALDAVAWIAASLTSLDGLDDAKKVALFPDMVRKSEPFTELQARTGLGQSALFPTQVETATPPTDEDQRGRRTRNAIRGALSELLQDEKVGRRLASQLLVAQADADTRADRTGDAAIFPTEAIFLRYDDAVFGEGTGVDYQVQYLLQVSGRVWDTGLGRGRVRKGLEVLISEYLEANAAGRGDKLRSTIPDRSNRLLNALINVGEKMAIIANLDVLLQDSDIGGAGKYTRLLQAIGNSIISQVDALRQLRGHQDRMEGSRDIEVAGLRNAERRASPALQRLASELESTDAFPDRDAIVAALRANQSSLKILVSAVGSSLLSERGKLEAARNASAYWTAAMSVVASSEMQSAIIQYAAMPGGNVSTTATLVQHMSGVLSDWAGKARMAGGAGDAAARRFDRASALLTTEFTGQVHQGSAGDARVKHTALAQAVGQRKDRAAEVEAKAGRIVAALDRAHGVTSQLAGGVPMASLPSRFDSVGSTATAKDVLDVMLTTLRYEHVEAVRQGRESEIAKDRLAAVELLYAYRSGMIHIRPAATFLRNSYPASVLQGNPSANVWRNMLTDHANRQLPLYDFYLSQQEDAKIIATIDKQFWQRVNQVRVAGAGRTNYAIAKDDVGNWYVKDYGSNPTDMIRSAQNLALFAAGPAMGANILARPGARQTLATATGRVGAPALPPVPGDTGETGAATGPTPTAPVAPEAPRSTLQRQLERHAKKYEDATLKAHQALRKDIDALWGEKGRLHAAAAEKLVTTTSLGLMNGKNAFLAPTNSSALSALTATTDGARTQKSTVTLNADIAEALRAVKAHRREMFARVDSLAAPAGGTFDAAQHVEEGQRTLAKQAINTVLLDLIERALRERQAATGAYEQAILFIGETAGL